MITKPRKRPLATALLLAGVFAVGPTRCADAAGCGRPWSRAPHPQAGDALYVLRAAVGSLPCPACECDADANAAVQASDALAILRASVGSPALLSCPRCPRYNFVVFLTDDQRADATWAMPIVQQRLATSGVTFTEAFSSTGECCPFRASFHSGGFRPGNTGVKRNAQINGAMSHFRDVDSLGTRLQRSGYATGFIGKYMHGYYPRYVPPGWTTFVANEDGGQLLDWFHLKSITRGTSMSSPADGKLIGEIDQYLTDFHRDEALDFVRRHGDEPFFLFVSMYAPHWPIVPSPGDEQLFGDYVPRSPAFGEQDLGDKPTWVQETAGPLDASVCVGVARDVLRTLQSVDRLVGSVVDAVAEAGAADRTYYVFTSDNGTSWGEHRLPCDKGTPYEEVLRVPLIVAGPELSAGSEDPSSMVPVELDLPATILDLAGLEPVGDGSSLVPALRGDRSRARTELLIENYGYLEVPRLNDGTLWSGLRVHDDSGKWKYVEYPTGESELYDLDGDPYELRNLATDPDHAALRASLAERLAPQKGLALLTTELPPASVGTKYRKPLESWGGTQPLRWTVVEGTLPEGLVLGVLTGRLHGTPTKVESRTFTVRVTDSSLGTHSLEPQQFNRRYTLEVGPQQ